MTVRRCAVSLESLRSRSQTAILRVVGVVLICALLLAAGQAQQKQPVQPAQGSTDPTQGSTYVGADTCKTCHQEIYEKSFINTPHSALLKQGKHGCEDCHGPGSAHVNGGGDVTKIIRFPQLSASEASARCITCHQATMEVSKFSGSMHMASGVGCLSCHSPHHATVKQAILLKEQPLLCYSCHAQQKAEFERPYRHRVNARLLECSDCHNPHGTFLEKQVRTADGGLQICTKCHTEKAGPFVFEHVPVKQAGCTSCHTPHGSTNPRLLRVSQINILCLQCHSPINNNPTPDIPTFHNQAGKYQACTMCHTQIHGSNFNEFFFK